MLASLRTRLERMREELRRDEQQLTERYARQETAETNLRQHLREAERLRAELEQDKQLHDQERQRFAQRQAVLEAAVTQLREAQETLTAQQEDVGRRQAEQEALAVAQAEEAGLLRGRAEQLAALQERVRGEQQALRDRETALVQSEKALAGLQEQLRRRSEEIAARQRSLEDQARRHEEALAGLSAREADAAGLRQQAEQELAGQRAAVEQRGQELAAAATRLGEREQELAQRDETLRRLVEQVKEDGRDLDGQRQALADERAQWEAEQRQRTADLDRARAEHEAARLGAVELQQQLPELEARAVAAGDRLALAREQVREALGEVHAYAAQSRQDLEALLAQVQAEAERVRQQELALHRTRDEHRLAVAAFRQQLIDWQSQVAELKRSLAQGESRLERRQAEVEEQVRQADVASARLAEQAEQLQEQQREVAERRGEMQRHLEEMREWYRRKLRELAGTETAEEGTAEDDESRPSILTMTGELEPGDRQLGDLLRSLELVDADTLTALLVEARRQRRSLRQLLLSGNYLTLYQVALIEAGNLDGLVLGPVRVIDRLHGTPHEVVYRVFDPRRGQEALLRHLAEAEMEDAVRPDEFRQRFAAAAAVQHAHVAATWEVLEIAGRPAVLQEWLTGLPGGDWPPLTAVPGVWYRLVSQVASALQSIHQAGLVHGHLHPGLIVLTGDGTLKVSGLGEPAWLLSPPPPVAEDAEERIAWEVREDAGADLAALGRMATAWAGEAQRKGARAKPLPESLQEVLRRLTTDNGEERYPNATALVEALEQASADVSASAAAWDRLLRQVREQAAGVAQAAA
jgi:hypothetical protein